MESPSLKNNRLRRERKLLLASGNLRTCQKILTVADDLRRHDHVVWQKPRKPSADVGCQRQGHLDGRMALEALRCGGRSTEDAKTPNTQTPQAQIAALPFF